MAGRWSYGLAGVVLAVGAVALLYLWDENTMNPWYLLLLLTGTGVMSFIVGLTLGYLTDRGLTPGSEGRE